MNIANYQDVVNYLQNKQVYLKIEIVNNDYKTIAESNKVYNIGEVELTRIRVDCVAITVEINNTQTTMYLYYRDIELFKWIKSNFIPVSELVKHYN